MNQIQSAYEQIVNQMLEVTRTICRELDELEDLSEERLEQLQNQQVLLREQITALSSEATRSENVRIMLEECLELESQSLHKMHGHKLWLLQQINGIREGLKARDAYRPDYAQTEGYFIDKQK